MINYVTTQKRPFQSLKRRKQFFNQINMAIEFCLVHNSIDIKQNSNTCQCILFSWWNKRK